MRDLTANTKNQALCDGKTAACALLRSAQGRLSARIDWPSFDHRRNLLLGAGKPHFHPQEAKPLTPCGAPLKCRQHIY